MRKPLSRALRPSAVRPVTAGVLGHDAAAGADHERGGRGGVPGRAQGDEGVQSLHAVGEAVVDEERERAVGERRLGAEPVALEPGEHVVGAERGVALEQDLQHAPTHRR